MLCWLHQATISLCTAIMQRGEVLAIKSCTASAVIAVQGSLREAWCTFRARAGSATMGTPTTPGRGRISSCGTGAAAAAWMCRRIDSLALWLRCLVTR